MSKFEPHNIANENALGDLQRAENLRQTDATLAVLAAIEQIDCELNTVALVEYQPQRSYLIAQEFERLVARMIMITNVNLSKDQHDVR